MNAATLEARGQTSVADIGNFSPNVNPAPAAAANSNGGVGIYIDDVYYGATFGANLENIAGYGESTYSVAGHASGR